jgi:spore coat polysaccharide biosynthesis protein SpsF
MNANHHSKVLVVVQCRFRSVRLPGKALYPLGGVPLLVFLLRRLRSNLSSQEYQVVLATSENPADDPIYFWGVSEAVSVVRGDEDDVLSRFHDCLTRYPAPYVVRVTADNPLTCPVILQAAVRHMQKEQLDYVISKGNPCGAGVDVFSARMLRYLNEHASQPEEREHINKYILDHVLGDFQVGEMPVDDRICFPQLRLTVDTSEDYQTVSALIRKDDHEPWNLSLDEIVKRMDPSGV